MKQLTKAEEEVMQVLWKLGHAFAREIRAEFPEPQPAYNTISTIIRILEQKGFVSHEAFGKSYRYYPLVSRETYKKATMKNFLQKYFGNSFQEMVSFFVQEEEMDIKEMEAILERLKKEKNKNDSQND